MAEQGRSGDPAPRQREQNGRGGRHHGLRAPPRSVEHVTKRRVLAGEHTAAEAVRLDRKPVTLAVLTDEECVSVAIAVREPVSYAHQRFSSATSFDVAWRANFRLGRLRRAMGIALAQPRLAMATPTAATSMPTI